ncbi:CHASE domain-containing protein [Granulosicoccus sp. 3-233]|uniref:CHASE domain-containing protein n=1 Tax=Granulosicoccus sp. 3-233 TaxID=3417969 RepID=UPI003D348EAA
MRIPSIEPRQSGQRRTIDLELLKAQQSRLRQHARLHWTHWFILCLSLVITVFAWQTSESALIKRDQIRFEHEAERAIVQIRERLGHYEDALLSGVAAMQSHGGEMSREQWRRYSEFLNLNERYPGISGIGVIHYVETADLPDYLARVRQSAPDFRIFPEHAYDLSLPITYIEPEEKNRSALGLDVAFETNRRTAALYARASGIPQVSGPITLVQDAGKTPGFLFYAPFYEKENPWHYAFDPEARKKAFRGLIYSPLVVAELINGALGEENPLLTLSLRDGDDILYAGTESAQSQDPAFRLEENIETYGRLWTYTISSTPLFENASAINQPIMVLISGLCLDAMLFALFWLMSRSNRNVLELAEEMTNSLSSQAQQLSEKNHDLESFAHIVSHDLKTPLRNIHSLSQILEEDLDSYLASNDPRAEIQPCLNNLQDQVTRSQSLISGILEYSVQDGAELPTSIVDTRNLMINIIKQLDLKPEKVKLVGTFPALDTNKTRLEQVFTNLIQNAFKYNPDKHNATVCISSVRKGGFYQFSISDNGPGIEPRFHDRIFEPFTTLESVTDIHSSGIGLSIVQRAIERQGGRISVSSSCAADNNAGTDTPTGTPTGTTFTFTWPVQSSQAIDEPNRKHA